MNSQKLIDVTIQLFLSLLFQANFCSAPGPCFHCYLFISITSENTYSNLCAKSKSLHCRCMNGWYKSSWCLQSQNYIHSIDLKFFQYTIFQLVYVSIHIFVSTFAILWWFSHRSIYHTFSWTNWTHWWKDSFWFYSLIWSSNSTINLEPVVLISEEKLIWQCLIY